MFDNTTRRRAVGLVLAGTLSAALPLVALSNSQNALVGTWQGWTESQAIINVTVRMTQSGKVDWFEDAFPTAFSNKRSKTTFFAQGTYSIKGSAITLRFTHAALNKHIVSTNWSKARTIQFARKGDTLMLSDILYHDQAILKLQRPSPIP